MDGLLILAIETATSCGSVSLTRGGMDNFRLLTECIAQPDITHSRRLMGSIQWAMQAAGVSWDDVDGIGVSIGPGSFTGLRIGLAAAKSIAMATGKPLLGVPTLQALAIAGSGMDDKRSVGVLLDARKKEVYAGLFNMDEQNEPVPEGSPMVLPPEDLLGQIDKPVLLVGPGVKAYRHLFEGNEFVKFCPNILSLPRAAYVGMLAGGKLSRGEVADPSSVAPMYVRASEAELNLKKPDQKI